MRRAAFLVCLVALVAAACTGGEDGSPTATATAGPTSEPTSELTNTPTALPATATPTATAGPTVYPNPTLMRAPVAGQQFAVIKVHRSDPDGGLNLRSEPFATSEILAVIPFSATDVIATGEFRLPGDVSLWFEVTYDGVTGWANGEFLTPVPSFDEASCGDPASDYASDSGPLPGVPAPNDPPPDRILSIHHVVGTECERTVITFGRALGAEAPLYRLVQPAVGVPAGVAVSSGPGVVRVTLPDEVAGTDVTATESLRRDNGGADWLFVRPGTAPRFAFLGIWDRHRMVRTFFLENPGRLVIDTIDGPAPTDLALGAVVPEDPFALTVLPRPINLVPSGPPPEPPIEVVGYGRPFEATTTVRLRTAPFDGAPPGSGDPVTADWSGSTFAESCGSTYAVMTTDYLEAWGRFEFVIEALAAGSYELFVGEDSAQDGRELGVYHVFTIGGGSAASC